MKQSYIPVSVFIALLVLLVFPFSFDFTASGGPGGHSPNPPKYSSWRFLLSAGLLLAIVGYWLLSRFMDEVDWTPFIIHFVLTFPVIVFLRFSTVLLSIWQTSPEELSGTLSSAGKFILVTGILFVIGQILFNIYFFSRIRSTSRY